MISMSEYDSFMFDLDRLCKAYGFKLVSEAHELVQVKKLNGDTDPLKLFCAIDSTDE